MALEPPCLDTFAPIWGIEPINTLPRLLGGHGKGRSRTADCTLTRLAACMEFLSDRLSSRIERR